MILAGEPVQSWVLLIARVFLAMVFLVSGVHKAIWYRKAVQEFRDAQVRPIGLFLPLTIALHLLASLCLLAGIYVQQAALALAAFLIVASLKVHRFWRLSSSARLDTSRDALANLAIVGGLLLLSVTGGGTLALWR